MAAKPKWLTNVRREAVALLRASDTFDWLNTEMATQAATRLRLRAANRNDLLDDLRAGQTQPGRDAEFDKATRLARAEAKAQQRLAEWLEVLSGRGAGGGDA